MSLMSEIVNVEYIYFVYELFVASSLHTEQHAYHSENLSVHLNN